MPLVEGDKLDPTNPAIVKRAKKIYDEMQRVFQPRHTVRKAELTSFKHLDHAFYEETQRALEGQGFRQIADIENTTLSEVYPANRTVLRAFLHRDGPVSAACYNMRFTGWMRFVTWILRLPRDIRVVEFETEFDDGAFICTTNAVENHLDAEDGVTQLKVDSETPIAVLLQLHLNLVDRHLTEHPDVLPVRLQSYDDILASQDRLQALKSAYRLRIGYLTEKELARMSGPNGHDLGKAMYAAIQNLHRADSAVD